jgi:16S rRNA processing protein RimM
VSKLLPMGRVHGHRGRAGDLTVRIASGDAARWSGASEVWLQLGDAAAQRFDIERDKAYRDRWVLKLKGLDDANEAEQWRGASVSIAREDAPPLDEFEHWHATLVGMDVVAADQAVGRVRDIQPTKGADLLVVQAADGAELLIPLHRDIVIDVDERANRVKIEPPNGLLELNRGTE